jgi:hypothetical protein
MDFAEIAATAIGAITPYLAKGGEKLAEEAGHGLWELIKKPFTSEHDRPLIAQLEEHPADPKTQTKVELKLEEHLRTNPEMAEELERRAKQVVGDDRSHHNTATTTGGGNTMIQDTHSS